MLCRFKLILIFTFYTNYYIKHYKIRIMKKASLLLGALLLVGSLSFAGENKEKKDKKAKMESCSKDGKGGSCCAKKADKKTAQTATKGGEINATSVRSAEAGRGGDQMIQQAKPMRLEQQ